jgi:hypothetical protein
MDAKEDRRHVDVSRNNKFILGTDFDLRRLFARPTQLL